MYKVMIVDDEPPLIRSLKRTIEKNSGFYEVIAEAFNGAEALAKMPEARPDVVFTDIKMPLVDGISLVNKIGSEYPEVFPVIVSGYQDFDYARAALKAGVAEYLVKPVDAPAIANLLDNLKTRLDNLYTAKRKELLKKIMVSQQVDNFSMKKFLDFDGYLMFLVLKGAPIKGPSPELHEKNNLECLLDTKLLSSQSGFNNSVFLQGRNENESLIFACLNRDNTADGNIMAQAIANTLSQSLPSAFYTIVYTPEYIEPDQIAPDLAGMYKTLNQRLVLGKTQLISLNPAAAVPEMELPAPGNNTLNKLTVLFQNRSCKALKEELSRLFKSWGAADYPLTYLERLIRQILQSFERCTPTVTVSTSLSIDQQLEEILSQASGTEDVFRGVWDITEALLGVTEKVGGIGEDLITRIDAYIKSNLSESFPLQRVCELFGLSQPHLSRLFRQKKNMSFNEYVTYVKITEAKHLILEQPEILMKDIAEMVGYQDQHYFSRVFKAITGNSPTDFRK